MLQAIKAPFITILENACIEDNIINGKQGEGINVVTGEKTDMIKAGVIDPVLVTK